MLTKAERKKIEKVRQHQRAKELGLKILGREPRCLLDQQTVERIRSRRFKLARPVTIR